MKAELNFNLYNDKNKREFPSVPVVRDSSLFLPRAWIQSLVSERPHKRQWVAKLKKKKGNKKKMPIIFFWEY